MVSAIKLLKRLTEFMISTALLKERSGSGFVMNAIVTKR